MTRIVSTDRLYAYFDIDEQTYLNYLTDKSAASTAVSEQPVAMRLANESDYDHWGQIDFIDNRLTVAPAHFAFVPYLITKKVV